MENRFYVGQEVLCVDLSGNPEGLQRGVYTVEGIKLSPCCKQLLIDVGVYRGSVSVQCTKCKDIHEISGNKYFLASRFIPIDNTKSELTADEVMEEIEIGELLKGRI